MCYSSWGKGFVLGILMLAYGLGVQAQNKVQLNIQDALTQQGIVGASIQIPPLNLFRLSGEWGQCVLHLSPTVKFPVRIFISCLGYQTDTVVLAHAMARMNVNLQPGSTLHQVVVSASRMPESMMLAGVTVEKASAASLEWTPGSSWYDALALRMNLQVVQSGLLFPSYSSRGFSSTGNFGFNQVIDGMNLESPGLNLRLGDFMGVPELDLDYVELLNGASTVLYGAGGANGTLVFKSKDPFEDPGLQVMVKAGLMRLKEPSGASPSPYESYALRYAHQITSRLAFKVNAEMVRARDWVAGDTSDYSRQAMTPVSGSRQTDPAYDGVNLYGDEISANLSTVAASMVQRHQLSASDMSWVPDQKVSRTGFSDAQLLPSATDLIKLNGAWRYRIGPDLNLSGAFSWSTGTVPYTGSDRYALNNLNIWQGKLQLEGKHLLLRVYRNQENTHHTYDAGILAQGLEVLGASNDSWYSKYVQQFIEARKAGSSLMQAYGLARASADSLMPVWGSAAMDQLVHSLTSTALPKGAAFIDRSYATSFEGLYRISLPSAWGTALFGGNFRRVRLNSNGTIYDDQGKRLLVDSWGLFGEWTRAVWADRLHVNAAVRYDQLQYLDHHWTPRLSLVWKLKSTSALRVSIQSAYQLPSNQQQYIDLNTGRAILVGDAPELLSKYHLQTNPVFLTATVAAYARAFQAAYQNNLQSGMSDTAARESAYRSSEQVLTPYSIAALHPETVRSLEVGYRAVLHRILYVDMALYDVRYRNFLGPVYFQQATGGPVVLNSSDPKRYYGPALLDAQSTRTFGMQVNSTGLVESVGASLSLRGLLPQGYMLTAQGSFNKLYREAADVQVPFNTPKWQGTLGISNPHMYRQWGASLFYRCQSSMTYTGNFASGRVPGFGIWNMTVGYTFRSMPVLLQVQAQNLLNTYYRSAYGNPSIGGLYLISLRWKGL